MTLHLSTHNLGLGTKVSGSEDERLIHETLGEGIALLIADPKNGAEINVYYKTDSGLPPVVQYTITLDNLSTRGFGEMNLKIVRKSN